MKCWFGIEVESNITKLIEIDETKDKTMGLDISKIEFFIHAKSVSLETPQKGLYIHSLSDYHLR